MSGGRTSSGSRRCCATTTRSMRAIRHAACRARGAALLQGGVWCGRCGHKMTVEYKNGTRYVCNFLQRSQGGPLCQHLSADPIDARVVAAFFAAVGPTELEAWEIGRASCRERV